MEEEGLDAQTVASQQQPPPRAVPEREREHAANTGEDRRRILGRVLVEVEEHFRVRGRAEAVTLTGQSAMQLAVIVDLAVERKPHAAVLVGHRLAAVAREVDDGETPVDESDTGFGVDAFAVRTAAGEAGRELLEGRQ